jgi:hypothetical protein
VIRVLFVAPMASHPQNQGNSTRLYALARAFRQQGVTIDFIYYNLDGLNEEQIGAHRQFWNEFDVVPAQPLPRMAFPDYWGIDDWCPEALCDFVGRKVRSRRCYNAVIVNYVWMSGVFEAFDGPVKILDTHDLFGERHKTALSVGMEPRWFFTSNVEEDIAFSRADIVIGIQDNESEVIRHRTSATVATVGHLMAPNFLLGEYQQMGSIADFGYIGSGNQWNMRSIKMLDEAIGGEPSFHLALAGTISTVPLVLKSNPIRVGHVDNLGIFYRNVDCIINPMAGGTGLKIKTIEAMAYGRPILGTKSAFEGIETDCPFHALENPKACVEAMKEIAGNREILSELTSRSGVVFLDYQATTQSQIKQIVRKLSLAKSRSIPA